MTLKQKPVKKQKNSTNETKEKNEKTTGGHSDESSSHSDHLNNEKILLHTCCADCGLKAVNALQTTHPNLTPVLFNSNSNIHPRSEYFARQKALKKIANDNNLELIGANWSPKTWFKAIGNDSDNTDLRRCQKCWHLRLENTAQKARKLEINKFSTTLLTSHYQNNKIINRIGEEIAEKYCLQFISIDPETAECQTTGFYKQNFCGCVFSLQERYLNKFTED
jgi:hypothetical protein